MANTQERQGWLLIGLVTCFVVVILGAYLWRSLTRPTIGPDNCVYEDKQFLRRQTTSHVVIIIDQSELLSESHKRQAKERLLAYLADDSQVPERAAVMVYVFGKNDFQKSGAGQTLAPAPFLCKPPSTGNEVIENKRKLSRVFRDRFVLPMNAAIEQSLDVALGQRSPILEMIQYVSRSQDIRETVGSVQRNLRVVFFSFVIVGTIIILAFTNIFGSAPGKGQTYWGMIVSVLALMVVFGVIVGVRSRTGQSTETDGEAFYYLGFIYTLVTLVATFYPLLSSSTPPTSQHVLGLFGLGLITTFVGLSGRIFFLQTSSAKDTLEEGPQRLGNAYIEAARQLEGTSRQIARVGVQLEETVKKSHDSVVASIEQANKAVADHSTSLIAETSKKITALTEAAAREVTAVLQSSANGVSKALDDFQSRILAVKLPPAELGEQLKQRIDALITYASAAGKSFEGLQTRTASMTEAFGTATSGMTQAASSATALRASIEEASRSIDDMRQGFGSLRNSTREVTDSFGSTALSVRKLEETAKVVTNELTSLHQSAGVLTSGMNALKAQFEKAEAPFAQLATQVETMSSRLPAVVEAVAELEKLKKLMQEAHLAVSDELKSRIASVKLHQDEVEKLAARLGDALRASEEAIRKVHENLIKATQFIIAKAH